MIFDSPLGQILISILTRYQKVKGAPSDHVSPVAAVQFSTFDWITAPEELSLDG